MMCPKCYGTGSQVYVKKLTNNFFLLYSMCLRCNGKGVVKAINESDLTPEYLAYTQQYKPEVV